MFIRLSTAHANALMAKTISVTDAKAAIELVLFTYLKKVLKKEKSKRRRSKNEGSSDVDEDDKQNENGVSQALESILESERSKNHRRKWNNWPWRNRWNSNCLTGWCRQINKTYNT